MVVIDTILTQPSAGPVIHALRSIGYNPRTAVADLIDNSIDAKASSIHLNFEYNNGDGYIQVIDNGYGMNEDEIQVAMSIGSKDPLAKRQQNELGRFGMGLKTASFSLGKRLSVISKKDGRTVERCWDLDYVSKTNEWQLHIKIPKEVKEHMPLIEGDSGTIVHIDKLDRFMRGGDKPILYNSFYTKVKKIYDHIAFVFHSLIAEGLKIDVNTDKVKAWDPFLSTHDYTSPSRPRILNDEVSSVKVSPYVLPHVSYFNQTEYKGAGGPKGWNDQQGFYIYRENRLLYFGDWLDLFPKDQASQLARIRIDIGNASDEIWQVDIKKSTISPPENVRDLLKAIAKETRNSSKRVFYFRTQSNMPDSNIKSNVNTWKQENDNLGPQFTLNRTHPLLGQIMKQIDDETARSLKMYLKLIELGSPANIIAVPKLEEDCLQPLKDSERELILQLADMYSGISETRNAEELANIILMTPSMERFNRYTIVNTLEGAFTNE